jgi:arylsulfatase A-like enzyme
MTLRSVLLALTLTNLSAASSGDDAVRPPNIIVVLVDDLGWGDLGADVPGLPGVAEHLTPAIAAFAKESMTCTHAYSAAPNCAPSRASLQTGRYTPRHGVLTVGSPKRGKAEHRALTPPSSRRALPLEEVTLAEHLKAAGYSSAHVGKWHLGDDPMAQGYDVNVGGQMNGHPKSYFAPYKNPSLADGPEGEYLTTRLTSESIELLDKLEPPFFLHLAYYTVHTPLQAPESLISDRKAAGAPHPRYAAMVTALDGEFARLLAGIKERGLDKDTLIVFTSDNGGYGPATNQEPLRGFKGTLDEGGVRVPFMVRWPGRVEPRVSTAPIHHVDLFPTLGAIASAPPTNRPIDGLDLSGHWTDATPLESRSLAWHFPCYLEGKSDRFEHWRTTPGGSILLDGRWKLVEFFGTRADGSAWKELYDLRSDPREENDLATKHPDKIKSLTRELVTWRKTVHATVPTMRDED